MASTVDPTPRPSPKPALIPVMVVAALVGIFPLMATPAAQPAASDGAFRGYLAVRLVDDGEPEVVDQLNADGLFVPASVLKVLTVAAALEHLGPGYRWLTRLTSPGVVVDGVLEGDLLIEPGADPTWGNEFFDGGAAEPISALVQQVRARGVTRVQGDLVVDTSRFPGRPHPTDRSFGDLPYQHGTPAAALAVDEATVSVRATPGSMVGEPARLSRPHGLGVINLTRTVGREHHGAGTLDFFPVWGTNTLLLRGEYPISEPAFSVTASDPAPELRAAHLLRVALRGAGVVVDGQLRLEARPAVESEDRTVLAEHYSPPLADLLEPVLTKSHNWYADMLALSLALEVTGTGRFDDGVTVVAEFASEPGAARDEDRDSDAELALWIRDGSGLSPANLVTPATVVGVLAHALRQPWGEMLVEALARPGTGTLRAWPRLPPLAAKTGTLRHTVALAGVINAGQPRPVIFCYFVNHHPERPRRARTEIARAVNRWR